MDSCLSDGLLDIVISLDRAYLAAVFRACFYLLRPIEVLWCDSSIWHISFLAWYLWLLQGCLLNHAYLLLDASDTLLDEGYLLGHVLGFCVWRINCSSDLRKFIRAEHLSLNKVFAQATSMLFKQVLRALIGLSTSLWLRHFARIARTPSHTFASMHGRSSVWYRMIAHYILAHGLTRAALLHNRRIAHIVLANLYVLWQDDVFLAVPSLVDHLVLPFDSSRQLRIAAMRCFPLFLIAALPKHSRIIILENLFDSCLTSTSRRNLRQIVV